VSCPIIYTSFITVCSCWAFKTVSWVSCSFVRVVCSNPTWNGFLGLLWTEVTSGTDSWYTVVIKTIITSGTWFAVCNSSCASTTIVQSLRTSYWEKSTSRTIMTCWTNLIFITIGFSPKITEVSCITVSDDFATLTVLSIWTVGTIISTLKSL